MGLSLMNMLGPSSSVRISLISCYWKFFLLHYIKSSVSPGFAEQTMPILLVLCCNGSSVTWTVVSLTTVKFQLLIFSVSGFALSYTTNMFIIMILYDFSLLPAQFCYIIVYIRKVESLVQIADRYAPWKIFHWCGERCYEGAGILRGRCLPLFPRRVKRKSLYWSDMSLMEG
jgi:hypothetical protein